MDELSAEELQAILGTDYETVLAELLRRKGSAEDRRHQNQEIGQVGDGQVFFDPFGAINNVNLRRKAGKESAAVQSELDKVLAQQTAGRTKYAEALTRGGPPPAVAPDALSQTVSRPPVGTATAPPQPQAPPPAPMAQELPDITATGGNPIQALIRRLRGR